MLPNYQPLNFNDFKRSYEYASPRLRKEADYTAARDFGYDRQRIQLQLSDRAAQRSFDAQESQRGRDFQSREFALNRQSEMARTQAGLASEERRERMRIDANLFAQARSDDTIRRGQELDYRAAELNDAGATRRAQIAANAQIATANISAGAQRYGADRDLEGRKYASDRQLEGVRYSSDKDFEGRKYTADRQLEGQMIARLAEQDRSLLQTVAQEKGQTTALLQSYLDAGSRVQAPQLNILASLFGR